jgi:transposase
MRKPTRRTQYGSNPPEGYVNTQEALKILGVSRRTMEKAVEQKKLRAYTFALEVSRTTPRAYKLEDLKALKARIQRARRAL